MKSIIFLFILFHCIYCNMDSCSKEKDYSNCTNHNIELNDFSCYQLKYFETIENKQRCIPFPDEAKTQELYWQIFMGTVKEFCCVGNFRNKYFGAETLLVLEKESYNKGEEIYMYPINGTESFEDMERYESQNTCFYKYYGNFSEEEKMPYQNITDKNICYNVDQFDELKNLFNCGYGEIKYIVDGKTYGIKSCFFVPNKNLSVELRKIYKKFFVDKLFENGIIPLNIELSANKEIEYDIIVEDKNGQKVEYSSDLDDIKFIDSSDLDDFKFIDDKPLKGSYLNFGNVLNMLFILFIFTIF